jgi:signal transduction histidine kinase
MCAGCLWKRQGELEMSRGSYALHQRFDLAACGLLLALVWDGWMALGITRREQDEMRLLVALHEQGGLVNELTDDGARLLEQLLHEEGSPEHVAGFQARLAQLANNLGTLREGGALVLPDHQRLQVRAMGDPTTVQQLNAALAAIELYRKPFHVIDGGVGADTAAHLALPHDVNRLGRELRTVIHAIAAGAEHRFLAAAARGHELQLAWGWGAVLVFLIGVLLCRRFVIVPLRRIAHSVEAMRRTGRLAKLPVVSRNELGVVTLGFNLLVERVEEQMRRLHEHVVELQRVNAELTQLATLKDEFLMTINHQLRTPLTSIIEGLELMRDGTLGPLSEEQRLAMQTMDGNALRLDSLIEEVLDLSLMKSGRRPLKREPGDLAALLRSTRANWEAAAQSRTIRLLCSELPPVYMDANAVQEVLDHLLRNALRHAPPHSEVFVEALARDSVAEVSVHDGGPGISQGQLGMLFQPFAHIQTPDAPGSQGSGLGLAFCRQMIERHHGSVRAESSEGKGTTLTFTLPVASPRFLFEEACRCAQEEAEYEDGQFGVLLAAPADSLRAQGETGGSGGASAETHLAGEVMHRAETLLRSNTHHGDRFVWLDELRLAVVAVTDGAGLDAMAGRLRRVLDQAQLAVHLVSVLFPHDGDSPDQLLNVVQRQLSRQMPAPDARMRDKADVSASAMTLDVTRSPQAGHRAAGGTS